MIRREEGDANYEDILGKQKFHPQKERNKDSCLACLRLLLSSLDEIQQRQQGVPQVFSLQPLETLFLHSSDTGENQCFNLLSIAKLK